MLWHSRFSSAAALLYGLLASTFAGPASAMSFPRAVSGDGFISIPINRQDKIKSSSIQARDPFEVILGNLVSYYMIEISLGRPAQTLAVLIDTGSSDLWVTPNCGNAPGRYSHEMCLLLGTYDPLRSSTVDGPVAQGSLHYGDATDARTQTSVNLKYYTDSLTIGDVTLANQTFGVTVSGFVDGIAGIFGLAPDIHEGFAEGRPYSLVLNSMKEQGFIESRAFSLDLRHADELTGAVIYGGLDVKKFTGPLAKFPMQPGVEGEARYVETLPSSGSLTSHTSNAIPAKLTQAGAKSSLAVWLSSIGVSRSTRTNHTIPDTSNSVLLDSGTTLTRLHPQVAQVLLRDLDATMDDEGSFLASCSLRATASTVDFGFSDTAGSGLTLRVPMADFILAFQYERNPKLCYVGLRLTEHQQVLGDSVMRGGYFVFDWDNQEIHIAQASNCGSEIVAIGSGPDAVPAVSGKCTAEDSRPTEAPTAAGDGNSALPTTPYTTTFTITECPSFDLECTPGMLTTQTFLPLATDSPNSDDQEDAAWGLSAGLNLWTLFATGVGAILMVSR
ncbi:hypothetical protein jhhlp_003814 [Lomentospora prolificans]|uniref:Peptidase A1 domain-containing protein n=1 Tax=Lomentospora prolificans TaxID=41688 RepID=A0A2N3N9T6_9PEZI|nr:hypothetical protein jhhlp_003814 [Lomentospora prolificans]